MTTPANAAASLLSPDYLASLGRTAQTQMLDAVQSERFRRGLGRTLLGGVGVGAAVRGLNGLYNTVRRNVSGPSSTSGPRMLPVPVLDDEEEKLASLGQAVGDFFSGRMATSAGGIPTFYPAAMLAGIAGLAGGWQGTDALLDSRRRSDQAAELDAARSDYEKALLKQGDANASELGRDLDSLFQVCSDLAVNHPEKTASLLDAAKDVATRVGTPLAGAALGASALGADNAGKTVGMALTAPTLLALATGAATYGFTRGHQQEELLQKAVQRRRARQLAAGPLYAFPSHEDGTPYAA
jgi:hypothetical protein